MSYERIVEFCEGFASEYMERRPHFFGKTPTKVALGEYELDSQKECNAVLQTLMDLRLEEAASSIRRMRSQGVRDVKESHIARLEAAEKKVKDIVERLRY